MECQHPFHHDELSILQSSTESAKAFVWDKGILGKDAFEVLRRGETDNKQLWN
jgi:hypothetical protein